MLPMEGNESSGWTPGEPTPFLDSSFAETQPAFSADGRWLAYTPNESGRSEVYVRPFPGDEGKWQISPDGGTYPTWSPPRKELFFYHPDGRIMVATYTGEGESFRAAKPRLWSEAVRYDLMRNSRDFALHPDGDRFAVFSAGENEGEAKRDKVTFIFNFFDELERLASTQ